jgi:hypothetical protein
MVYILHYYIIHIQKTFVSIYLNILSIVKYIKSVLNTVMRSVSAIDVFVR